MLPQKTQNSRFLHQNRPIHKFFDTRLNLLTPTLAHVGHVTSIKDVSDPTLPPPDCQMLLLLLMMMIKMMKRQAPSFGKVCPIGHHLLGEPDLGVVVILRPVQRLNRSKYMSLDGSDISQNIGNTAIMIQAKYDIQEVEALNFRGPGRAPGRI